MHQSGTLEHGFTLPQLLLAVTALLALAIVLPPILAMSVNATRMSGAARDANHIAEALRRASADLGGYPRWVMDADRRTGRPEDAVRMLTGPGVAPKVEGDASWLAASSDTLTRQLVHNGAGYPISADGFGWRGPYLQPDVGPDPWGNQFIVWFADGDGATRAIVVSAGTNGTIDTDVPGLRSIEDTAADDVIVVVPDGAPGQ